MNSISSIINWISLLYLSLPFLFIVFALYHSGIKGKSISRDNMILIISISKWYIVSVAIVLSAKTVEAGFKERETGLKEMQVYDKYAAKIIEADNIEIRWKLAEYFSTVTPTERLRERWEEYKRVLKEDYDKFKKLEEKERELMNSLGDSLNTKDKINSINDIRAQKSPYLISLSNNEPKSKWVIVLTAKKNLNSARKFKNRYNDLGINNPIIILNNSYYRIASDSYKSKIDALRDMNFLKNENIIGNDAYIVNLNSWCDSMTDHSEGYFECQ